MKKVLFTLVMAMAAALQAFALTPNEIRENARFLSDRMAYELHLTPEQYEDCYEINYDFIASINPIMDGVVYGHQYAIDNYYEYLDYRNDDLRYILNEMQYRTFMGLDYFFRPIYTVAGSWLFRIHQVYHNLHHFYYDVPSIYYHYHGAHARHYHPHGYYVSAHRYNHRIYSHPSPIRGSRHMDNHRRHDFGHGYVPQGHHAGGASADHREYGPAHHGNRGGEHRGNDHGNRGGNDHGMSGNRGGDHRGMSESRHGSNAGSTRPSSPTRGGGNDRGSHAGGGNRGGGDRSSHAGGGDRGAHQGHRR